MVSQSSSIGYTIIGKTADLTVVQKTTIDTLHKEGKTQKVIAKEAGFSQSSVSKHINREAKGRKRCGRKKCTSNRDNRTLERTVKQNPFKNVGEIHKEWTAAGVSASRTTTHRRMQDMGFSCRIPCVKPLLNNRQRQKRLAWAKDKKDLTAAEWSKVMFSDETAQMSGVNDDHYVHYYIQQHNTSIAQSEILQGIYIPAPASKQWRSDCYS
ncbi:Transposable element Tc1 transposase [Labeo rohita]|uniref:Transposable element Tc1 transposase n=1 Tax=Labeo rohita TaxID=84645 RepID=A0ABQ8MQ04_LABRO|nr:Transposable element Tc1 transposase [Labeo rohita]